MLVQKHSETRTNYDKELGRLRNTDAYKDSEKLFSQDYLFHKPPKQEIRYIWVLDWEDEQEVTEYVES